VNSWLNSEAMNICRGVPEGCTPPTQEEAHRKVEKNLRTDRLVLVGSGDLLAHRIDRFMLVDYDTETVLYPVPVASFSGVMSWKFPLQGETSRRTAEHAEEGSADKKDFGVVAIGTHSSAQFLDFEGSESQRLTVDATLVGDSKKEFEVTNGCQIDSYTSGSCGIGIQFTPRSAGEHNANLLVNVNGNRSSYVLTGSGVWPWDIYADSGQ
jgi:hypothetical protein